MSLSLPLVSFASLLLHEQFHRKTAKSPFNLLYRESMGRVMIVYNVAMKIEKKIQLADELPQDDSKDIKIKITDKNALHTRHSRQTIFEFHIVIDNLRQR